MSIARRETEVIVVGSGPGGATIARALALLGQRVTILERGLDHRRARYYGTHLGAMIYTDRLGFQFSREGMQIIQPIMVGGATNMFCGSAAMPPAWLLDRYQLDLDPFARAAAEELQVEPLPPSLRGAMSTRIAEAASTIGQDWQPQLKFMRPSRARQFSCGAKCMLGCRCHAKWSAAEWVDEAVEAGAELLIGARVTDLLRDGSSVCGVRVVSRRAEFLVEAPTVILAAGGLGSAEILRGAGFADIGDGLAMDTTAIVYGLTRGRPDSRSMRGTGLEPPMTWSYNDVEHRYMLSTLVDPWLLFPLVNARSGWRHVLSWRSWRDLIGVMIKLKDDLNGAILPDGTITKPLTEHDRSRLDHAIQVARRILVAAGAAPDSIFVSPLRGTIPSGTVRFGQALSPNLETALSGLYVCDASVFPEALGQPTVLTIIALAKRLVAHLAGQPAAAASVTS